MNCILYSFVRADGLHGLYKQYQRFNPLNPHDALKHRFASLKNDLISCT